ncbi:odorant receptor 13a-like [Leptopilina heterotoma]|uniref:odorant receptor 13a-like n=1 Tax=Leptopilina heterotoma TaxID=63436 RepID=UPI001CA7DCE8|nr:odorant receptor 13a-like [Leptopilina heterotoma]
MSHFKTNRFLLFIVGLWPLQRNLLQEVQSLFTIISAFCMIFLHIGTVIVASKEADVDIVLETFPNVLHCIVIIGNAIIWIIKFNKIKDLLTRVHFNWKYFLPDEISILEKYAHKSEKLTKIFAWIILAPIFLIFLYTTLNSFTKSFSRTTGTTIHVVFNVKNFFNIGNYYYSLLTVTFFGSCVAVCASFAVDSVMIIFLQHACGMFTILTQRMQNITAEYANFYQTKKTEEKNRQIINECLTLHKSIIEFSDLLNSIFSLGFLLALTLYTVILSFASFCALEYRHKPPIMMRYAMLAFGSILHQFTKFWQCQSLIDHSATFRTEICNSNWYNIPPKTRTILYIMLMRSDKVCKVTAGKFFEMSFHTFSKILSTAASYFTVLTTLKE